MTFTVFARDSAIATAAIAAGLLLTGVSDADAAKKKKKSYYSSGYSVTVTPSRRRGTHGKTYNFTTWERDTTHEGYGKRYGDHFRYFGRTPTVDYNDRY